MQRYGQKISKMPPKWGFSPICDPQDFFFENRALSLLYPYGTLTSCKKLEKSLERSLRYLKTDHGPRTDGQGRLLRTPLSKPGVQNMSNIEVEVILTFVSFQVAQNLISPWTGDPPMGI